MSEPIIAGRESTPTSEGSPSTDRRPLIAAAFLGVLLALHMFAAFLGWDSTSLVHNGFREAQTAISAHFIQQHRDFALAYPTPVLGPPWTIPMEFPLFQWVAVLVSDLTGITLIQAGKLVSLLCFYHTNPAYARLAGELRLVRSQRHVLIAAVVSCPLYVFYARAFLIETMALMFSAWFLVGYVRVGQVPDRKWAVLAMTSGVLAALVKVTTLLFFLLPAAAWSLWWMWFDLQQTGSEKWKKVLWRAARCASVGIVPVIVALFWINFADGIKTQQISGDFLTSENLRGFNYGYGRRFTGDTWSQHLAIWFGDLAAWPVLLAASGLALVAVRRRWQLGVLLILFFMLVQVIFPLLYAFHAYYYVANAWTLMMAIGLVGVALLESRFPRGLAWILIAALLGGQITYAYVTYWTRLNEVEPGNAQLIAGIRQGTDVDDVLIVAGDDWSSVIPYSTARRALMLRTGVETDRAYLERAFASLKGEKVGALIVKENQRYNAALVGQVRDELGIDGRAAFSWENVDVYLAQGRRDSVVAELLRDFALPELTIKEWQTGLTGREVPITEVPPRYEWLFAGINPLPTSYFTAVPLARYEQEERSYFDAQPPKRLSFRLSAGEHTFGCEIGILPGAYEESIPHGDRTDGIHVLLSVEAPGAEAQTIFTQEINPRDRFDQRGLLKLKHSFTLEAEATVVLTITPGPRNNAARDWVIMGPLSFR